MVGRSLLRDRLEDFDADSHGHMLIRACRDDANNGRVQRGGRRGLQVSCAALIMIFFRNNSFASREGIVEVFACATTGKQRKGGNMAADSRCREL